MKAITYFSKSDGNQALMVQDYDRDHLRVAFDGGAVILNAVQVDKLRQQFHGWLHERASASDGVNWVEAP